MIPLTYEKFVEQQRAEGYPYIDDEERMQSFYKNYSWSCKNYRHFKDSYHNFYEELQKAAPYSVCFGIEQKNQKFSFFCPELNISDIRFDEEQQRLRIDTLEIEAGMKCFRNNGINPTSPKSFEYEFHNGNTVITFLFE